eukprot:m.233572 g.233572  ORF g.233572 m.233572 type:complete len:415 (-) comp22457_c0_seq2:597-1841(-)
MAFLIGLSAGGGVPLFNRSIGHEMPAMSMAIRGSLYGTHLYAAEKGVELLNTSTASAKLVWKKYQETLILVLVCYNPFGADEHTTKLLDRVFMAMTLVLGEDLLQPQTSADVLRRELRACFAVTDHILGQSDHVGPQVGAVELMHTSEWQKLQEHTAAFAAKHSARVCVTYRCRVVAASDSWWELDSDEIVVLAALLASGQPAHAYDIPVYLPITSPKVPFRLLKCVLASDTELWVLCGQDPSLSDILDKGLDSWQAVLHSLEAVPQHFPRCVPPRVEVDRGITAYLLLDRACSRCLCSLLPQAEMDSSHSPRRQETMLRRRRHLLAFYHSVAGRELPLQAGDGLDGPDDGPAAAIVQTAMETYMCGNDFKAYAIRRDHLQLFAIHRVTVPTYSMRSITGSLFDALQELHPFRR